MDKELDPTSENPVENKAVCAALGESTSIAENLVPDYDDTYSGKALTVNDTGELEWDFIVPDPKKSNTGTYLYLDSSKTIKWVNLEIRLVPRTISQLHKGCALCVDQYGIPDWTRLLPVYETADANKALCVRANGKELEWKQIEIPEPQVLPDYDETDAGKVLCVDALGTGLTWAEQNTAAMQSMITALQSQVTALQNRVAALEQASPAETPSTIESDILVVGNGTLNGNSVLDLPSASLDQNNVLNL